MNRHDFFEILGGIGFCVVMVVLFWLYLLATPDQMSAECDWARAQMDGEVR